MELFWIILLMLCVVVVWRGVSGAGRIARRIDEGDQERERMLAAARRADGGKR